jgi:uncharacterized protein YndB with AHSA1/START domain
MTPDATADDNADGYRSTTIIRAPRRTVFDALTTVPGLEGWWASEVAGSPERDGTFELRFRGAGETITMRVDDTEPDRVVAWTCLNHSGLTDWNGTGIRFDLSDAGDDCARLAFRHRGLVPELPCYEQCHAGWDHFLGSLVSFAEGRGGTPFTSVPHGAER